MTLIASDIAKAHCALMGVIHSRLKGKEHAPRRPHCSMRITLGDGLIAAEIRPKLTKTPAGWVPDPVLELTLRDSEKRAFLPLLIHPSGKVHPARMFNGTRGDRAETSARLVLALLGRGLAYLMAASNATACACCGRPLTDPESREVGIGPECIEHFHYRHNGATEDQHTAALDLAEQVRGIRREIAAGSGDDWALYARLDAELKRLRGLLQGGEA